MGDWTFLTNHACALVLIAHAPEARLRDLAIALDVTERTAYGIVADLTAGGYLVKVKAGRRNRYLVQPNVACRGARGRGGTIGQVLAYSLAPEPVIDLVGEPDRANATSEVLGGVRKGELIGRTHQLG